MSGRMHSLGPSGHVDEFARRNLPPFEQWPELILDAAEFQYPEYLNAGVELTDRMVEQGFGDHTALIGNGRRRTYKELADWTNRLARALVENYGVKPGNRVLIRSANNPAMVACWLAATKAGAVVVNTMPMLRAGELGKIIDKAEVALALTLLVGAVLLIKSFARISGVDPGFEPANLLTFDVALEPASATSTRSRQGVEAYGWESRPPW